MVDGKEFKDHSTNRDSCPITGGGGPFFLPEPKPSLKKRVAQLENFADKLDKHFTKEETEAPFRAHILKMENQFKYVFYVLAFISGVVLALHVRGVLFSS